MVAAVSTSYGYNGGIVITITVGPYVTGSTASNTNLSWPSTAVYSNYAWVDPPCSSTIRPINRQQRRILESGKLPENAVGLVEEVNGPRGKYSSCAAWDQFFFEFWRRKLPKDRAPRHVEREHQKERYASPLRRFAGGKFVVRKS